MTDFNPLKLKVRFILPASPIEPIMGRKYTLTHSDDTGQLFLDIGIDFNYEAINEDLRDEVIAEWQNDWEYRLIGRVYVDSGEHTEEEASKRYNAFKNHMNGALQGMVFGDRSFLSNYPLLLDAPIYILFESTFPQFRKSYYYGTPQQYVNQFQYQI
ncbi:staygreen family protein [Ureibacillus aquaedulcis]|uniref:Staygreen family protein n=1 Tax=Ureibacillus aquaedulcis TaxID=3058421 RepID=A0ABT8GKS8_9BACL|nr:staygreen family protein [Ureibacillus sp. BA0131]MDN4492015.1 staygreen family protein [Ureibacillus sp. BA0131]